MYLVNLPTEPWPRINSSRRYEFLHDAALVGAGPAGLTLARLLSMSPQSPSFIVFGQDTSAFSRTTKSGTLDLHDDTGIAALKAAGFVEEFFK